MHAARCRSQTITHNGDDLIVLPLADRAMDTGGRSQRSNGAATSAGGLHDDATGRGTNAFGPLEKIVEVDVRKVLIEQQQVEAVVLQGMDGVASAPGGSRAIALSFQQTL